MDLETEPYLLQQARWPVSGRHIMAQFDSQSVVVYQAYRPAIGLFAAEHSFFGGPFKLDRMSWIKPSFLWMMYRSGWATKEGQEVILAVRIRRSAFDSILSQAVHSTYHAGAHSQEGPSALADAAAWRIAVKESDVRLQWDPDRDPSGLPIERRAIQLGLRGAVLAQYSRDCIIGIEDISNFVRQQHQYVLLGAYDKLYTPKEEEYPVEPPSVRSHLGLT